MGVPEEKYKRALGDALRALNRAALHAPTLDEKQKIMQAEFILEPLEEETR